MQPCTVLTVRELRSQLGLTQAAFAHRLGTCIRNVVNWESGRIYPSVGWRIRMQVVARYAGLTRLHSGPLPIRRYDPAKMDYHAGKPGPAWRDWSGQRRAAFLSHRVRYAQLRADIDAGRVDAQPIVACLDNATDIDAL